LKAKVAEGKAPRCPSLQLFPRQPFKSPSRLGVTVIVVVERPFESVEYVDDTLKARVLKHSAGIKGAFAAAADEDDGALEITRSQLLHFVREMWVNFPIRRVLPRDMFRALWVADIEVLDLAAAIDEKRIVVGLQKFVGGFGFEVVHP
jgi:hypothetical protein